MFGVEYSGGPHTGIHEFWEVSLRILGSLAPLGWNPQSGALKSTLPGPRKGSSILNADLVVVIAAVCSVSNIDDIRLRVSWWTS